MYFIYDCNDNIIGNTKGYRTYRGAVRQQDFALRGMIWETFDARTNKNDNQVCSIKLRG